MSNSQKRKMDDEVIGLDNDVNKKQKMDDNIVVDFEPNFTDIVITTVDGAIKVHKNNIKPIFNHLETAEMIANSQIKTMPICSENSDYYNKFNTFIVLEYILQGYSEIIRNKLFSDKSQTSLTLSNVITLYELAFYMDCKYLMEKYSDMILFHIETNQYDETTIMKLINVCCDTDVLPIEFLDRYKIKIYGILISSEIQNYNLSSNVIKYILHCSKYVFTQFKTNNKKLTVKVSDLEIGNKNQIRLHNEQISNLKKEAKNINNEVIQTAKMKIATAKASVINVKICYNDLAEEYNKKMPKNRKTFNPQPYGF